MADMIKFYKGLEASLPASGVNGALYITTDEGAIYLGTGTGMKRLGDFVQVANVASLPAKAHESCLYYCVAENILAKWNGTEWKQINKQPTAEELKTLLGLGDMAYVSTVVEDHLSTELKEKINASAEGNHSHANKEVLDGITADKVTAWDAAEKNAKDHADTELAKKVDKVEGKSLVSDTEITKLAGVSAGANKVEKSETNGNIKIDGVETVVYTHPVKHNITDIEGLQDALDGKQGSGDYAAEDHKHVKADITDFAHTHTASEVTDLDATIKAYDYVTKTEAQGYANAKDEAIAAAKKAGEDAQKTIDDYKTANDKALADEAKAREDGDKAINDKIGEVAEGSTVVGMINKVAGDLSTHATEAGNTYETKDDASAKLAAAKKYTEDKIAEIPAQTDYTVTITENTDDTTVAKTYVFTQCGAEIGSIKLAKELVVTSGSVKEVETADAPYAGAKVGEKYIELVIANQDTPIYVPAKDLVDIYTAKDGAAEVQVAISNTNEISATLVNGGVTEEKLAEGVKTKLNKVWEEVGVAKGLVDGLANGQVKTNKEAIENITKEGGLIATAKSEAISAAETKAGELDEALHTAISKEIDDDVKALADGAVKTNTDAIENITKADGLIATAESNAKTYAEEKASAAQTAAEGKVTELAGKVYTKEEVDAAVEAAVTAATEWGSF